MYPIPAGVTPNALQVPLRVQAGQNGFLVVSVVHTEGITPAEALEKSIVQAGKALGQAIDMPFTVDGEGNWSAVLHYNDDKTCSASIHVGDNAPVKELLAIRPRLRAMVGISIVRNMEIAIGPGYLNDEALAAMEKSRLHDAGDFLMGERLPVTEDLWISSPAP